MDEHHRNGVLNAVRSMPTPCWLIDRDSRLLAVSDCWRELLVAVETPQADDWLPGARVLDGLEARAESDVMARASEYLLKALDRGSFPPFELPLTFPAGLRWFIAAGRPLAETDGELLLTFTEITERRAAETALQHQARHDALTGLANRSVLTERLQQLSRGVRRGDVHAVALFFLDLDDFKAVNDEHGHDAGDMVLREVAERLSHAVRATDLICRLGGDEFVVVVPDMDGEIEALAYAERLTKTLELEVVLPGGHPILVSASCGIAFTSGSELQQLLTDADIAMLHAKATGRHQVFDQALDSARRREAEETGRLRTAIESGEIVPWFQPVVRLTDGAVLGAEALARWPEAHSQGRDISQVIALAERTGLIASLDRLIYTQAAAALVSGALGTGIRISVNASPRQITTGLIVKEIAQVLAESGASPSMLAVEVTESAILTDPAAAAVHLAELAEMGVQVALDDFGTGFSSLSHLLALPLHIIKVDRSFVAGIV
ncbi:MAG: rane protein, partial [Chthonomonadaceae bacterium]|nr:rane protein [Chthonomonadaceae bacterium]